MMMKVMTTTTKMKKMRKYSKQPDLARLDQILHYIYIHVSDLSLIVVESELFHLMQARRPHFAASGRQSTGRSSPWADERSGKTHSVDLRPVS